MKISLISPYENLNSYGIRSISTYLRAKGVDVSILYLINDFRNAYKEKALNQSLELCADSDLIGISVMSNYLDNCIQITQEIKKRFKIPVAWGGIHSTTEPQQCLSYCDIAVIGEGEITLLEMINRIQGGEPIREIQGACVKENGRAHNNSVRPPMQSDSFPVIDNDFTGDYILLKDRISKVTPRILEEFMTRDYVTLSSFGCPFSCTYCLNNKLKDIYANKVRFRKADDVINEIVSARKKMPFIKHITFDDDAFLQRDLAGLEEFARKYREKVNLPFFVSGIHPDFVSEDKIKTLISAGMDRVKMGIQTGSKNTKILYNRHTTNEKIIDSAKVLNKYKRKLKLTGFDLILDNPFETKQDLIETIGLLSKLPAPFTLNLFSLTFFPGTEIRSRALAAGLIREGKEEYRKHYKAIDNNYLNFVILLFALFKVPGFLLKILLNRKIVSKEIKVPKGLFRLIMIIGFTRRGLNLLLKGDPYTLSRHLKIRLVKA